MRRAVEDFASLGNAPSKMKKNVEDFATQDYPVLLHRDKEGDYIAEIPDLPGCMTDAKTKEEALRQIEDAKRTWIAIALEKGVEIPLPRDLDEEPSGKLLVRLPKSLHRSLRWEAEREGVSLNHCIVFLLTKALALKFAEVSQESVQVVAQTEPDLLRSWHVQHDPWASILQFACAEHASFYSVVGVTPSIELRTRLSTEDDAEVDLSPIKLRSAKLLAERYGWGTGK